MIEDSVLIHTPTFSGDSEVKNMKKEKLDGGICKLAQIWALLRGKRQKLFRYLR